MHTLHVVCGLPASGKTTFAIELAKRTGAAFFDSDTATDLVIQAGHRAAGLNPHDRDSKEYKKTYRLPVYETLFALAQQNLNHTDVIIAGPFTEELRQSSLWKKELQKRFETSLITIHHISIDENERHLRMQNRGALRDKGKLS